MAIWANIQFGTRYLGGPSANPSWHVPRALHSLYGEIEAADTLIRSWEPLLSQRQKDQQEATTELGVATTCVVVTGLIAERAIKTLIAQTSPQGAPPHSHKLSELFRENLAVNEQDAVQRELEALPTFWDGYAETATASAILDVSSTGFVDWRYAMEPTGATGGLPKPLLTVAVAVTLVGMDRLSQWQQANGISASTS